MSAFLPQLYLRIDAVPCASRPQFVSPALARRNLYSDRALTLAAIAVLQALANRPHGVAQVWAAHALDTLPAQAMDKARLAPLAQDEAPLAIEEEPPF